MNKFLRGEKETRDAVNDFLRSIRYLAKEELSMTVKLKDVFKMNAAEPGKTWFDVQMLGQKKYVVDISGVIGDYEVDPQMLVDRMSEWADDEDAETTFVIDSPGGSVGAGVFLMTFISKMKGKTVAEIWSRAWSMASMLAMACDEVKIAKGGSFMIHNPRGLAYGTASEIKAALEYLDGVRTQAVDAYAAKVESKGHTREEVEEHMTDAGKFFTALQAVEFGFADVLIDEEPKKASMSVDKEFAAVMLGEIPDEIDVEIVDANAEQEQEEVKMVSVEFSVNGEMFKGEVDEASLEAVLSKTSKQEKPKQDPVLAEMKDGSNEENVVTARPEKTEDAQMNVKPEPAPWVQRIAEMNRNFGQFD